MSEAKASHSNGMWAEVSSSAPHLMGGTTEQTPYRPHILPPTLPIQDLRNALQTLQYKTEQAQKHTHT
jgi:hypothetical protein